MATTEKGIYYPTDYTKVADVPADFKQLAESVDKAIDNIPEYDDTPVKKDINKLKENDEQQDKDIESLQTKQTELETEIQELEQDIQSNAIIEETEQAKSLYIDDASGARGGLSVEGNNEQDTREGYNLIDIINSSLLNQDKGVSIEIEDDGYIIANGTPTSSYIVFIRKNINDLIEDGKTYSIWQEKYGSTNASRIYAQVLASPKEGSGASQKYYQSGNKRTTFVADKENYDYSLMIQTSTISEAGTFNNYKNRYMIYKGTDDKPFELYGEMPSSQYLSEVNVLEAGSTEIKKLGKNIMPINNLGTTWEYTKKGIKNLGRSTGSKIGYIKVKKGQTVKFGLILFSKPSAATNFTLASKTSTSINTASNFSNFQNYELNTKYEREYTAEEDIEISYIMYGNADSEIFEFQLWAEFDTLTDYEQYKEEVYSLDIQQDMFLGDNFNLNTKKEVHFWKEIELDGTESLSYAAGSVAPFQLAIQDFDFPKSQADMPNIRSNQYSARSWSGGLSTDIRDYLVTTPNREGSTGTPVIRFKDSDCSTLEEFKAKLAQQKTAGTPVKLYYKSTQKTELDLTEAQIEVLEKLSKLRFYKGVNNIFTTEDIALLQAKYSVDLKSKNNKMQQEIDEIKELLSTTQTSAMLLNNLEQDLIEEVK